MCGPSDLDTDGRVFCAGRDVLLVAAPVCAGAVLAPVCGDSKDGALSDLP